jgi:hypothetical protein
VGVILSGSYSALTGSELAGNEKSVKDPPDRLFAWQGVTIGAEMFELEAFYDARGLCDHLRNAIYAEFHKRGLTDRYVGTAINLALTINTTWQREAKALWASNGDVGRTPVIQAASELTDLVLASASSTDDLPNSDAGKIVKVDIDTHPALGTLTHVILLNRCRPNDPRRSDGLAAPLVIAGGINEIDDSQLLRSVMTTMEKKIASRARTEGTSWRGIDHSILVAHDLPREHYYEGFAMQWDAKLVLAAAATRVLRAYDEFWFVSVDELQGRAVRIAGQQARGSNLFPR